MKVDKQEAVNRWHKHRFEQGQISEEQMLDNVRITPHLDRVGLNSFYRMARADMGGIGMDNAKVANQIMAWFAKESNKNYFHDRLGLNGVTQGQFIDYLKRYYPFLKEMIKDMEVMPDYCKTVEDMRVLAIEGTMTDIVGGYLKVKLDWSMKKQQYIVKT